MTRARLARIAGSRKWLVLPALIAAPTAAQSQQVEPMANPLRWVCPSLVTAGSANERTLLVAALVSPSKIQTALRPLGDSVVQVIASEILDSTSRCGRLRPNIRLWFNTNAARPDDDGAVWQGRGFTVAATAGVSARRGIVSLALRPLVYATQNSSFVPKPFTQRGANDYRDPTLAEVVDLPFRFGDGSILAVDPGESSLRLEARRVALGVTTASLHWGPAHYYPLLLGTEGAGYPRAFAEARALPMLIGSATAQWHVGLLEASPYTQLASGERSRIASALFASFSPKVFEVLEVGASRYFHVRRTPGSLNWTTATLPFSGLLKKKSTDVAVGGFNQLASVFFRIAPAGKGIEAYGEYFRDDHSVELRDLVTAIDHTAAYNLGVRHVRHSQRHFDSYTLERGNGRFSDLHRLIGQAVPYTHFPISEGHTFRGQPLGSIAYVTGGGTTLAWERIEAEQMLGVRFEIRDVAPYPIGVNAAGRGTYALEVLHRRAIHRRNHGVWIRTQLGGARTAGPNVTFGLSWSG